jgi:hypothetical protein
MKKVRWVSATVGAAMVAATLALPGAGVAYASGNGNMTGNGNISLLSGNSVTAPVSVPVDVCGLAVAVVGFSNAGCEGGSSSTISGVGDNNQNGNMTGIGNIPVLSGNTITAPVSAPVNVCGIAVAVLGFSNAECQGGSTSCIGSNCNTPCMGNDCHTPPPCHGSQYTPPGCQVNCSPNTPPGPPQGTSPGGTTTTVITGTMPSSGLPTTGADLLLLGVAALGTVGVGAGAVALARRRRNGEAQ